MITTLLGEPVFLRVSCAQGFVVHPDFFMFAIVLLYWGKENFKGLGGGGVVVGLVSVLTSLLVKS